MGGQIVDATVAARQRMVEGTGAADRPGRPLDAQARQTATAVGRRAATGGTEIAVPVFGYKNHIGIDRTHGFIRHFVVTHAARHDGSQLAAVLDPANTASDVWADTAYRSKVNLELIDKRSLVAQFQRAKPRGRPMPPYIARGNATRARVRSRVEHVFAAEKRRMGLVVRTIGLARATAKITLANLAYNLSRLSWIEGRHAPV